MSFCLGDDEIREYIEDCENGQMTEFDLAMMVLAAASYECDAPNLHSNCYKGRCLGFVKEVYEFLDKRQRRRDERKRKLDELTRMTEEFGGYDKE